MTVTKTTPFTKQRNQFTVKKVNARERIVPMMNGMVRKPPFPFSDSEDEEVPFSKRSSLAAPQDSIFFPFLLGCSTSVEKGLLFQNRKMFHDSQSDEEEKKRVINFLEI